MKTAKNATASVKETVQNVQAKLEHKKESEKASSVYKAEKKNAVDKAGKHEAKAKKHATEAALIHEYEQKRADNAAQKEEKKAAIYQKKGDKHAEPTGDMNHDANVDQTAGAAAPSSTATPAAAPSQENVTPTSNVSNGPPGPVPMHGSGVPTQTNLHNANHDVGSTQVMGGTANTGSYM